MGTFLAAKYQLMNKRSTNKKDAYTVPFEYECFSREQ